MYELTGTVLGQAGFHRYEISNYAREGRECRHNKVYWRRGDYVGFGLGASSMIRNVRWKNPDMPSDYAVCLEKPETDGQREAAYSLMRQTAQGIGTKAEGAAHIAETETDPAIRMKDEGVWNRAFAEMLRQTGRCGVQSLTVQEQMEEFMFLGLRMTEGVDLGEFRRYFGKSVDEVYGKQIGSFVEQGLLERDDRRIWLTPRGIDVSNTVFAAFLL